MNANGGLKALDIGSGVMEEFGARFQEQIFRRPTRPRGPFSVVIGTEPTDSIVRTLE